MEEEVKDRGGKWWRRREMEEKDGEVGGCGGLQRSIPQPFYVLIPPKPSPAPLPSTPPPRPATSHSLPHHILYSGLSTDPYLSHPVHLIVSRFF